MSVPGEVVCKCAHTIQSCLLRGAHPGNTDRRALEVWALGLVNKHQHNRSSRPFTFLAKAQVMNLAVQSCKDVDAISLELGCWLHQK